MKVAMKGDAFFIYVFLSQNVKHVHMKGHFGFNKTMELMSQHYWWPQFWKYVKEFVGSCDGCAPVKNFCYCPHGLLQP
jgi:hypothetical protein